jgi:hypothetical protein
MDRKLRMRPKEQWAKDGYVFAPAVLQSQGSEGDYYYPTYYVGVEDVDGKPHAAIGSVNGTRYYPIESAEELKISPTGEDITFSSYGKIYTVRAFQDSDGSWASRLGAEVPATSLEERYMAEIQSAFSPNAPADDENLYAAVDENDNEVRYLVYSADSGIYIRSNNAWFKLPKNNEALDDLVVFEVDPKFIKIYDMAEGNNEQLLSDDVEKYEVDFRAGADEDSDEPEEKTAEASVFFAVEDEYSGECPPATKDIELNLTNRQNAIDNVGYGPLNPAEPNDIFWQDKAERWKTTVREAKSAVCGNCVFFVRTSKMLDCIEEGIGLGNQEAEGSIEAGELGYCNSLDFKCASERTCNAWAAGGPIVDDANGEAK